MRTIRIKAYKFDELSKEARDKAVSDHVDFEVEMMDETSPCVALEMEKMQAPWFLGQTIYHERREEIENDIRANDNINP